MDVTTDPPSHDDVDEGKLPRLFEGPCHTFPGKGTLIEYFKQGLNNGRINPNAVALVDEENTKTFLELDELSSKVCEVMRNIVREDYFNHNPDQDVVIGVCIPPSEKLLITLFAIEKLGGAYLPFDVSFPENRIVKIVNNARPILIISDPHSNVLSKFNAVTDLTKIVDTTQLFQEAESFEITDDVLQIAEPLASKLQDAERTAIVLYTSGSSGEPKGVRLSHRTVMNRLHWQWETFPFVDGDKCVFKTSLTFVDSVAEMFGPLLQGYPLIIFPKQYTTSPNVFIQKLDQHKITRLVLVPSLLKAIFQTIKLVGMDARNMLTSIKLWVCSGEAMTKDLLLEFFDYFFDPGTTQICNFYGSTEVMGDVTFVTFNSKKEVYLKTLESQVPIGEPVQNTVIYVLDEENGLGLCPVGEIGAIYVTGYNLATGYVGFEDHPSFITNPYSKTVGYTRLYKTGDYGRIIETPGKFRYIAYEGRIDSQIKVRGQRVDLSEIEMVLGGIPLIAKCKVLCYHPGQDDQAIVAFIVPGGDYQTDRIKNLVDSHLRDYERPLLRVVEDIPLLVNGKTDRQRLLKLYEQDLLNTASTFNDWDSLGLKPNNVEIAKIVLITMSEVTGTAVETLAENLDNSFFNVGGSSLNSIQVIVNLKEKNCLISIPDFLAAPNIRTIIEKASLATPGQENAGLLVSDKAKKKYTAKLLVPEDKDEVAHIIAHSFAHHGDLEEYTDSTYDDFQKMIRSIWEPLVEKQLSLIVRRKDNGKAVAVALNFDVYDEPSDITLCQGIEYVLEMLEFVESRQREKLPKGRGKLVHSFMMGTSEDIDEAENVLLIQFLEERVLVMAQEKGFIGVMTTNTNALTQQIARDIHGYEVLTDYQVNQFIAPDGTKPFQLAPDSFIIVCCWKNIGRSLKDQELHKCELKEDQGEDQ